MRCAIIYVKAVPVLHHSEVVDQFLIFGHAEEEEVDLTRYEVDCVCGSTVYALKDKPDNNREKDGHRHKDRNCKAKHEKIKNKK